MNTTWYCTNCNVQFMYQDMYKEEHNGEFTVIKKLQIVNFYTLIISPIQYIQENLPEKLTIIYMGFKNPPIILPLQNLTPQTAHDLVLRMNQLKAFL